MRNYYCLSEHAIDVLKQASVKLEIMLILGLSDVRTIDKHIKNNFHDGPLMNYNIIKLIRQCSPHLSMREVIHKLTVDEINRLTHHKKQLKQQNAKYNNENGKKRKKDRTTQTTNKDSNHSINHLKTP